MFAKPLVIARVAEIVAKAAARAEIDVSEVLTELTHMMRSDPADAFDADGHLLPIHEMPRHFRRTIASIKVRRVENKNTRGEGTTESVVEIKFWDKQATLDKLMRYLGMYLKDNAQKAQAYELALQNLHEYLAGGSLPLVVREPEPDIEEPDPQTKH